MEKEETIQLAQEIRAQLPSVDVIARTVLFREDYHILIQGLKASSGILISDRRAWEHLQHIASLLVCAKLAAILPDDMRPQFPTNDRIVEGLHYQKTAPSKVQD